MKFFIGKKKLLPDKKKRNTVKPSGEEGCFDILFNYKDYYYYYYNNSDFIKIFLNLLQEKGKKKKIKLLFSKIFHYFYYMVSYNDTAKDFFDNIYFLKYKFSSSNLYYTINIIIMLAIRDLHSSFRLICKKKKKKKKKLPKGEKKYYVQADYVFEEDRRNIALKWLHFYANSLFNKKFEDRLFKSIILTYTEGRESYLFKKKILIYEFYMNSKKKKDKF